MKVSVNWIREFTSFDLPVDKLVEKIGAQLGAVEEVIDLGKRYEGILIAKVVECQKHPNADKLSFCLVDDGGADKKVKRGKDGLIEVVCGAPNVKAGQLAVWIPPGAAVPSTFDKEPFVIEARDIRDKTSHGMLASPKELALGDNHEGILILDEGKPGDSFAKTAGLDDYVIDIENKMFTHRPDCFGMLGAAREIAGIQHQAFKSPDWYREDAGLPADGRKNVLKLSVKNDVPELVRRFCTVAIKDIKVGPSPLWLQVRLNSAGVRPINNIVDITNFYMLETGQPLHAYDYDKLKTGVLGARWGKKGEQLKLLGGKTIKIDHEAIVITDGAKPVGLGGVMGGADTEVDEATKNIVLEVANFDMNTTRRTAMSYGLFTDAATRFTKNQSPRQNMAVLAKAVEDIRRLAGGRQASPVVDDKHFKQTTQPVKLSPEFINSRLGLELTGPEIKKLLENVEFKVESGAELKITAPFWRTDIEIPEDIVEEVGRLYGYDKLPVVLPKRDLAPAQKDELLEFKARLRNILARAGANEVLTYSFVHDSLMRKTGQDPEAAYHIKNALSPDLQYYRLSLTPSLLDKVQPNIRAGFDEFAIFELGKGHNQMMKDKAGLPLEFEMLSLVLASRQSSSKLNGSAYFQARKLLDFLVAELGINLEYRPIPAEEAYPVVKPFDHSRSAQVWDADNNLPLGMVGEYKQTVVRQLKLPAFSAGFEIGIDALLKPLPPHHRYKPLNRFPQLEQDFCLRSAADLTYAQLDSFMLGNLNELCEQSGYEFTSRPIDIFQKAGDKSQKQTTWRIILWHPERTLTTQETNDLLDELTGRAKKELKAERI
jgi:phenylalanyl-tRNA synthetase beta chain